MLHLPFTVIKGWKLIALSGWAASCFFLAVSEAFIGQMIIALVVALIGATPPTVAIILMARKQSEERAAAQVALLAGQEKVARAVDGQLQKFIEAKEETSLAKQEAARGQGKEQERTEERERVDAAAAPEKVEIVQPPGKSVPVKPDKD